MLATAVVALAEQQFLVVLLQEAVAVVNKVVKQTLELHLVRQVSEAVEVVLVLVVVQEAQLILRRLEH